MIRLIVSACFALSLGTTAQLVLASPVQAQNPNNWQDQVAAMGDWGQTFNTFQMELVGYFNTPEITNLINEIYATDLEDTAGLRVAWKTWQDASVSQLEDLLEMQKNIPEPPRITGQYSEMSASLLQNYERAPDMVRDAIKMSSDIDKMVQQLLNGDESQVLKLSSALNRRAVAMLEAENFGTQLSMVSMEGEDHPNHSLLAMTVEQNQFYIEELNIWNLSLHNKTDLADRTQALTKMREHMAAAKKFETIGREQIEKQVNVFRVMTLMPGSSSEKRMTEIVTRLMRSFEPAFDIESQINNLADEAYALYAKPGNVDAIEAEISAIDERLFALVEKRLALQQEQFELLGQIQ